MKLVLAFVNFVLFSGIVAAGIHTYGRHIRPAARSFGTEGSFGGAVSGQHIPKKPPAVKYEHIVRRNLFKAKTGDASSTEDAVEVQLRRTKLDLKLWGTATGITGDPYAVIESSDKGQRLQELYRIGDAVQKATVKKILRQTVVLRVEGRDEMLVLEKPGSPTPTVRPAAGPARHAAPVIRTEQRAIDDSAGPKTAHVSLAGAEVRTAFENAGELVRKVRIRPYFTNGRPAGLSLTGIGAGSIFRRMGIRNGDIVTGLNGQNPRSIREVLDLFSQLGGGERVDVQVRRRGRDLRLSYTVE